MKNKRFLTLLLICLCLAFSFTSFAEEVSGGKDWNVEFNANKEMKSNFSSGSFDDVIDFMQPGDYAKFKVTIKNTNPESTDWYMTNKIIKSLEDASAVAKGGGYSYILTYTDVNSKTTVLFSSEEVGGESFYENLEGLHEATNSLKDFFYLDTLKNGQSGTVDLYVELDGETQGNDYQDTLAQLQMNFAVELTTTPSRSDSFERVEERTIEYRKKDDKVVYIQEPDTIIQEPDTVKIVRTGDETNLLPVVIIAILLAIILIILGILSIKLRKELQKGAKCFGLILFVALLFANSFRTEASGYFANDYTYTVRVFAGAQGSFSTGRDCITIEAAPGATIDLTQVLSEMQLHGKYYAKGIRESGKDNNTVNVITGPVFTVTQDMDYVVAYAMNIGDTTYTVNFVDASTGKALLPTQTYVGNVGEKMVVAYKYIAGYVPQAYNLTKTLVADETQNVLTFSYTKVEGDNGYYINTDKGITYIDVEGNTIYEHLPGKVIRVDGVERVVVVHDGRPNRNNNQPANNNNNAANNTVNNNTDNENNNTDANNEAADETAEEDNNQEEEIQEEIFVPRDIIDLDDEDVALSDGIPELPVVVETLGNSPVATAMQDTLAGKIGIIVLGCLLIITLILIIVFLVRDRKKQDLVSKIREERDESNS